MENEVAHDEVVAFRTAKNQTTPRFRHLALNAGGIQYLNEITNVVAHELSN